jgi:eukaryotic-like serine/threonine-protein kinase
MPLAPGTAFGPYQIGALIGEGGMGEVYRARDTRLGRDVALKVSKDQFTERFTREARTIAQLNHTNICHLYDVGPNYLVMEYVEGADLSGPLPFGEALPVIQQLIDGIEAAHEKNIIHRDLKPANIKITPEGVVKILDFGLAKAMEPESAPDGSNPENSPTLTMGATQPGTILGTAAYMAPEQARGKRADKRSDVWSFGVIVYELLTGRRPFQGESVVETLSATLHKEPDWTPVPDQARKLLSWCLEKDRKERLSAIGDARRLLREVPQQPQAEASARRSWLWPALAGLALLAAAGLAFVHFREPPPEQRSYHFQIPPPPNTRFSTFRLSPDGRWVAYIASGLVGPGGSPGQLWIRALDSLESHAVAGAEGATYPFWSADSISVGFFANGKLKRVAVAGGPVQIVCDVASARGGTWNRDGTILFADGPDGPILRVAASGGKPSPLTKLAGGDANSGHVDPEFLPDGKHFLYLAARAKSGDPRVLYVGSLDGSEPMRLLQDDSNATYAPPGGGHDGHLLFRREGVLMAVPFDAGRLEISGEAFPVAENVGVGANNRYGAFSSAADGTLAFWSGSESADRELMWMDRTGKRLGAAGKVESYIVNASPRLSPDEKTVAVAVGLNPAGGDIWLLDLAGKTLSRFTFGPEPRSYPVWSPDGKYLAYYRINNGSTRDIVRKPVRGGTEEPFLTQVFNAIPTDWSPDGKTILHMLNGVRTGTDIGLLPVEGERKDRPYLQTPANEREAVFSPDGRWIAYQSNEAGQDQIYVQSVPVSGAKFQISTAGGRNAMWSRDGREIYYLSPDQKMMAAAVKINGASFEAATPQALFTAAGASGFAVTRDGQRFLVNVPAGGDAAASGPPLTVITNWLAGVKK